QLAGDASYSPAQVHASVKRGGESIEAVQHGRVGDLTVGLQIIQLRAVDYLDVRAAPRTRARDNVRGAVAVDLGSGHGDSPLEWRVVGKEICQKGIAGRHGA